MAKTVLSAPVGCLVLAAVTSFGCGREQSDLDRVAGHMGRYVEAEGVPGGTLAVALDGEIVAEVAVGVRELGSDEPVTVDMLFPVGSMSKMITAAAVMSLVEEGALDLNAPITDYVPTLQLDNGAADQVTLHQLLTHTAGFIDWNSVTYPVPGNCTRTAEDLAATWQSPDPFVTMSLPGALWAYSNPHFSLAAYAAESASGTLYAQLAAERVFGPAGMETATHEPATSTAPVTTLHRSTFGTELTPIDASDDPTCARKRGSTGVYASVYDYLAFAEAFMSRDPALLEAASMDEMARVQVATRRFEAEGYGYGFFHNTYKGIRYFGHGGNHEYLGRSCFYMFPEQGLSVVVLLNSGHASACAVALFAVDVYLDLEDVPEATHATDSAEWEAYLGTYADPMSFIGDAQVLRDGDGLALQLVDIGVILPLRQIREDFWETEFAGEIVEVTFWREPAAGPVTHLITRGLVFEKLP